MRSLCVYVVVSNVPRRGRVIIELAPRADTLTLFPPIINSAPPLHTHTHTDPPSDVCSITASRRRAAASPYGTHR